MRAWPFFCITALLFTPLCFAIAPHPEQASAFSPKPLAKGPTSMIVTNNPYASKAAQEILSRGGNAIDAAITAGFVLGLTEPQSSGLGGGGYALVYMNKKLLAYDGRETAPHTADAKMFLDQQGKPMNFNEAMLNTKSIGVPSEIALFYELHKRYGKLPWKSLLKPAMQLAKNGFPMSPRLHQLLQSDEAILKKDPQIKKIYFIDEKIKKVNRIIKNPAYQKTLQQIADDPLSFYKGNLAKEIIDAINHKAEKNIFDLDDFANYQVKTASAVCSNYRTHYQICSVPPSSSGGITLAELLNMYAFRYNTDNIHDSLWLFYFLEASKLAYADRNQYLADPAFVFQPIQGLLDKNYLRNRSQMIGEHALSTPLHAGVPEGIKEQLAPDKSHVLPGTTSIVIVDKDNQAISMTLTIEHQFGSHFFTHGFFLNNELTDFSFSPTDAKGKPIANQVAPFKRPRSSISPVMVFKQNELYALSGSPGGSEIICYVAKNLILMLDMNLPPDRAAAEPNLCSTNDIAELEHGFSLSQIAVLKNKQELFKESNLISGITNIIRNPHGGWYGAADPRREGLALGH